LKITDHFLRSNVHTADKHGFRTASLKVFKAL